MWLLHDNKILNRGNYEVCLENALALLEENCLDYACYFALTYFEEYLKAHFARYYFSECALSIEKINTLAVDLFNSKQFKNKRYYRDLESANEYLKSSEGKGHIPAPLLKKWIILGQTILEEGVAHLRAEDIRHLIEEIRSICRYEVINSTHSIVKTMVV